MPTAMVDQNAFGLLMEIRGGRQHIVQRLDFGSGTYLAPIAIVLWPRHEPGTRSIGVTDKQDDSQLRGSLEELLRE
jgi:hypothetical protein